MVVYRKLRILVLGIVSLLALTACGVPATSPSPTTGESVKPVNSPSPTAIETPTPTPVDTQELPDNFQSNCPPETGNTQWASSYINIPLDACTEQQSAVIYSSVQRWEEVARNKKPLRGEIDNSGSLPDSYIAQLDPYIEIMFDQNGDIYRFMISWTDGAGRHGTNNMTCVGENGTCDLELYIANAEWNYVNSSDTDQHAIEYTATVSGGEANLIWLIDTNMTQDTFTGTWTKQLSLTGYHGLNVTVSGDVTANVKTVTCQIVVDGTIVDSDSKTGDGTVTAQCSF